MIVRILSDGQYELDDEGEKALPALDAQLDKSLANEDEAAFAEALSEIVTKVHEHGRLLSAEQIVPSDLALPAPNSTMAEVRELLASESSES